MLFICVRSLSFLTKSQLSQTWGSILIRLFNWLIDWLEFISYNIWGHIRITTAWFDAACICDGFIELLTWDVIPHSLFSHKYLYLSEYIIHQQQSTDLPCLYVMRGVYLILVMIINITNWMDGLWEWEPSLICVILIILSTMYGSDNSKFVKSLDWVCWGTWPPPNGHIQSWKSVMRSGT